MNAFAPPPMPLWARCAFGAFAALEGLAAGASAAALLFLPFSWWSASHLLASGAAAACYGQAARRAEARHLFPAVGFTALALVASIFSPGFPRG